MNRVDTDRRPVAVTDLAQLARCEQQMLLDRRFGKQRPPERERLAQAGEWEHRRHDRLARQHQGAGRVTGKREARCFVASVVYGESAWQTMTLRAWRDRVLVRCWLGRVLIRLYNRFSPAWARRLQAHPREAAVVRTLLDRVVAGVARVAGDAKP